MAENVITGNVVLEIISGEVKAGNQVTFRVGLDLLTKDFASLDVSISLVSASFVSPAHNITLTLDGQNQQPRARFEASLNQDVTDPISVMALVFHNARHSGTQEFTFPCHAA